VVVGAFANGLLAHYSLDRSELVQEVATFAFLVYMLVVPVALCFLKGERLWRWGVFALWLLEVAAFVYAGSKLGD